MIRHILKNYVIFNIKLCNIIPANGVNNVEKYLSFYDSCYCNAQISYKPQIKILFDNDDEGRNVYNSIVKKTYDHIKVECVIVQNFMGNANCNIEHNTINNEIEDFIYPEVICYLVNKILTNRSFNIINADEISSKIESPAFGASGIMGLIENEKIKRTYKMETKLNLQMEEKPQIK